MKVFVLIAFLQLSRPGIFVQWHPSQVTAAWRHDPTAGHTFPTGGAETVQILFNSQRPEKGLHRSARAAPASGSSRCLDAPLVLAEIMEMRVGLRNPVFWAGGLD
jgi:hypothetical protein